MTKVLFNSFRKSTEYRKNLDILFSDYAIFRNQFFSKECLQFLKPWYPNCQLHLTHSCTGALEAIALIMDLQAGDEIIMPSYTFVSTANAFALRGATPVFVDIHPETLCLDDTKVEHAITQNTKAIVTTHYAGNCSDMKHLQSICQKHNILLIEDAAMAFGSTHKNKNLGTFGDFAVISFDITKHISAVQGGLLIVQNKDYTDKAFEVLHNGTNRKEFNEGKVPYFEWTGLGSKFQLTETNAAILIQQLKESKHIIKERLLWSKNYRGLLFPLEEKGHFKLMPQNDGDNGHMFYILLKNKNERDKLADYMVSNGVEALSHYVPLHHSKFGKTVGVQHGALNHTEDIANCILRLPLHHDLTIPDILMVLGVLEKFYHD